MSSRLWNFLIFRELRSSFSLDFRRSDHRFSMEQEVKLFYAERATRGHRLVEFRQLQEVGIFSYLVYSLAKSHVYGYGYSEA